MVTFAFYVITTIACFLLATYMSCYNNDHSFSDVITDVGAKSITTTDGQNYLQVPFDKKPKGLIDGMTRCVKKLPRGIVFSYAKMNTDIY